MKKLLILSVVLFMSVSLFAGEFIIPSKLTLEEHIISIGTDFKIVANGNRIGKIEEKTLNLTKTFNILDINGNLVARSEQAMISWGTLIKIYDDNHKLIGSIQEKVMNSMFKVYTEYKILDANGKLIAQSSKMEVGKATTFNISNSSGKQVCSMKRPFINILSDSWDVQFYGDNIDRRLILFIPAYKTSRDNKK
jgi:uncharacterized protein YxjI